MFIQMRNPRTMSSRMGGIPFELPDQLNLEQDEGQARADVGILPRPIDAWRVPPGLQLEPMRHEIAVQPVDAERRLTDDELKAGLAERFRLGEQPASILDWLDQNGAKPTPKQIDDIKANTGKRNVQIEVNSAGAQPADGGYDFSRDFVRPFHMGWGGVAQGLGNTLGLVGNPLNAGVNLLLGTNLSTDLGKVFRDATGAPMPETPPERFVDAINQGGTGALTFAGAAGALRPVVQGGVKFVADRIASTPVADMVGGVTSSLTGEAARQAGWGQFGQFASSLLGGLAGTSGASRVGRTLSPKPVMPPPPVVVAGQAERVPVNRAMADPIVQSSTVRAGRTFAGEATVRNGMNAVSEAIEQRARELGQDGRAMSAAVGGRYLSRKAEGYSNISADQGARLLDSARPGAAGVDLAPAQSLQHVDALIARLSQVPGKEREVAFLRKFGEALPRTLSLDAPRNIRASLKGQIAAERLSFDNAEQSVLSVADVVADDIATSLSAAGKDGVVRQFRRADRFDRDRHNFIQGSLRSLIGDGFDSRQILDNFRAMAAPRGDSAGFVRFLKTMAPSERADIAATLAETLGKGADGQFSTAALTSQARELTPAASRNLFGADGARSLDNLIILADEHNRVTQALGPASASMDLRSAVVGAFFSTLPAVLDDGTTWRSGAVGGALVAKSAYDFLSARAAVSTDLTNWLRSTPATRSPQLVARHMDKLALIAARNPALQPDIQALQQRLSESLNGVFGGSGASTGQEAVDQRR
jgi:hypothetical protein